MRLGRVGFAAVASGLGLGLYARLVEPRWLDVSEVDLELPQWPASLDGLKLAVVGDLHLGRHRGKPWTVPALSAAVAAVERLNPDVLLLLGDFVYLHWSPDDCADAAARFRAPIRVAVFGNHEWMHGSARAHSLAHAFESRGIPVLVNRGLTVTTRGHQLLIIGLGDHHARRSDVPKTITALPEERLPSILLSHTPDGVGPFPADRFDVAFAGHTHGAQIALPFMESAIAARFARTSFVHGRYDVNGRPLFVTRGIGMVGYRARFRSRPEVMAVTIRTCRDPT